MRTKEIVIVTCVLFLAGLVAAEASQPTPTAAPAQVAPQPKPPANPLADALTEELHRAYAVVADLRVAVRMQQQTIQTLARRKDELETQVVALQQQVVELQKQVKPVETPNVEKPQNEGEGKK